jgi:hypothetical protein
MRDARHLWIAAGLLLLLSWGFWRSRHTVKPLAVASQSPLYTGHEALRPVHLTFPSKEKPGFMQEEAQIYATSGEGAQVKQVLLLLFKGPKSKDAGPAFPGWAYRDVFFTDSGLAVIDLDPESLKGQNRGTTGEYLSLYTLVKTLTDNFKDLKQVQLLLGGEAKESLAGHLDISQPLSLESF